MSHPPVPPLPPIDSSALPKGADAERDAWLSQALRHAPDADVAPPSALSELILREAQAKARPAAPAATRPRLSFWSRVWVWTAQPSVGAGLASVMVAGLIGMLMWDRPEEANSPRSQPTIAAAPVAEEARPPAPAAAADAKVADASQPAAPPTAREEFAKRSPAPALSDTAAFPSKPAAEAKEQRLREKAEPADKQSAPDAVAKAARTAEAMSPAAPVVNSAPTFTPPSLPQAAAPMPPPAPAPAVAPAPAAQTTAPTGVAQADRKRESNDAAGVAAPSAFPGQSTSGLVAGAAERSLDNLRAALTSEPAQWTWQRNGGEAHAIDDSMTGFLAEADMVAGGRWQAPRSAALAARVDSAKSVDDARTKDAASNPRVDTVRFMRDGRVVHTLRIDRRGLRWIRANSERQGGAADAEVPLDDAQWQRLRAALDKLGP